MAEALLNHLGEGRFKAYSAGSRPLGRVNHYAVETLQSLGVPTANFRSKSWDEFTGPRAEELDCVITVCDNAASEACPLWHGSPVKAHWGVADPAAVEGSDDDKRAAFRSAAVVLQRRIEKLLALPVERLGRKALEEKLSEIAR